jgi:poly [ADP-ribose] polymerase
MCDARTTEMLQTKLSLMETLLEIGVATELMATPTSVLCHPTDANYGKLQCDLVPLDAGCEEFVMVQDYIKNTHGHTHSDYKLVVEAVFKTRREVF